jgi:hypothetical protein
VPSLEPAALYGLAGEFTKIVAPHTEADPVGVLLQFHVLFGNVIDRSTYSRLPHASPFEPFRGPGGSDFQRTQRDRVFAGQTVFAGTEPAWTRTCYTTGLSSGEGLIYAVRDALGQDPGSGQTIARRGVGVCLTSPHVDARWKRAKSHDSTSLGRRRPPHHDQEFASHRDWCAHLHRWSRLSGRTSS